MSEDNSKYIMRTGFNFNNLPPQIERIINKAKQDNDLLLCLRSNEIHIYYRGGKILGIKKNTRRFTLSFDEKYLKAGNQGDSVEYEWLKDINKSSRQRVENDPLEFFDGAKGVMETWFYKNKKQERDDQHKISLNNADVIDDDDLAVVDIEYAVSANSSCYNTLYMDTFRENLPPYKRYPNPRFDIIAINKQGQIYVFELKTGLDSTKNCDKHITDFVAMIGSDKFGNNSKSIRYQLFLEEMSKMITELNDNRIRNNSVPLPDVDKNKAPIFGFVFTVDKKTKNPGHTPEYQKKGSRKLFLMP